MSLEDTLTSLLKLRDDTASPMYQQLFQQLAALIQAGRLAANDTLPSERHLAESLGISRSTVQRVYRELSQRRLVRSEGRHGFVVEGGGRLNSGMDRLKGFTEEARELGMVPSSRILERKVMSDRSIASIFGLPSNAQFLKLVRLRCGDDVPMTYEVAWYDIGLLPGLAQADLSTSVYGWIADHTDTRLAYCHQTIEAVIPTPEESSLFGFNGLVPCLLIKRRSMSAEHRMVEYVEGLFRGDRYTYRLTLRA